MRKTLMMLAFILTGCEDDKASVNCVGAMDGANCTVQKASGSHEVKVCWELVFQCPGGVRAAGKACQNIGEGATAVRVLRYEDFSNADKCDRIDGSSVENTTITRVY